MKPLAADDPRVIGEYRLRAQLGAGGMGRVYLGLSPAGRAVAIKVVHPDLASDAGFLRRFGQEVAAARAVSGIYTAPVVASGLNERPPWLATAGRIRGRAHRPVRARRRCRRAAWACSTRSRADTSPATAFQRLSVPVTRSRPGSHRGARRRRCRPAW